MLQRLEAMLRKLHEVMVPELMRGYMSLGVVHKLCKPQLRQN